MRCLFLFQYICFPKTCFLKTACLWLVCDGLTVARMLSILCSIMCMMHMTTSALYQYIHLCLHHVVPLCI